MNFYKTQIFQKSEVVNLRFDIHILYRIENIKAIFPDRCSRDLGRKEKYFSKKIKRS